MYKGTSSLENGVRKSPIKFEIRKDFHLITVSFAFFDTNEALFYYFTDFSALAKCDSPLFCLLDISGEYQKSILLVSGFQARSS